ncbi:glycosyltransferase family 87 protein [Spirulina subsalsa]|uniref:glycosyltransferase family 87 protein n=1 Tax=Spirulina subsalsa TaxID=54311 RepID=UPI0002D3A20E|nr:glycosyltransferase family 87 protein [Spirulina subsalsa]
MKRKNITTLIVILFWGFLAVFSTLLNIPGWILAVPIILLLLHFKERTSQYNWSQATLLWGINLGLLMLLFYHLFTIVINNIKKLPDWDFLAFWLGGKAAVSGLNLYDANVLKSLVISFDLTNYIGEGFTRSFLCCGFPYPPPSILLFIPLGWFEPREALLLWYTVNILILILTITLLWQIFLKHHKILGLLVTTSLILTIFGVKSNLLFAQTNFIVLLTILMYWRNQSKIIGGVWLGLGILIKPFVTLLLVYVIARRQWRVLVSAFAVLIGLTALTLVIIGVKPFHTYLTDAPYSALPFEVYIEPINGSLLANILRLTNYTPSGGSPIFHPLHIALGLLLGLTTLWVCLNINQKHEQWSFMSMLMFSLIIYPGSLLHSSVINIIPILFLWGNREKVENGHWWLLGLITMEYMLLHNQYMFIANMLLWIVLTGINLSLIHPQQFSKLKALINQS